MPTRLLPLLLRNLVRSRTRLLATAGGCAVAAFVSAFFLTAQVSLSRLLAHEDGRTTLVVTQKDRF